MNIKFLIYPILTLSLSFMAASCSSDDDKDEPGSGEAVDMPIPSSVVEGVRVAGDGATKINYNSDGSIKNAEYNGTIYDFEYEGSRAAASTGRKLVRIVARGFGDNDGESWQATNFKFNTDGFIASYLEKEEEKYGSNEWYKQTINVTISYNGDNRISSMNLSGTWEEMYDGEHDSGKAAATIKYSYKGGALESAVWNESDESNSYTYDYTQSHTNTYNIVTPQLGYGMGFYSPIAYVFATAGYLGNASSVLPDKVTHHLIDHEDPENSSSESYGISYTFNDKNRITSIISSVNGISYTTGMTYFEQ